MEDTKMEEKLNTWFQNVVSKFDHLSKSTADTLSWVSILVIILSTVPSFLAAMSGLTEKMPPLDIVMLVWFGLLLFFIRSAILKDMLMVVTIGIGFALQAILLGLIFFV